MSVFVCAWVVQCDVTDLILFGSGAAAAAGLAADCAPERTTVMARSPTIVPVHVIV